VEPASTAPGDSPVVLPDEVRRSVVALAAETLSSLAPDDVPPTLRAVARFTPAKRARLAAGGLAAALETDPAFRRSVADVARERDPMLADAVADGVPLPAAPPEQLAAMAYLLRPAGWQGRLAAAAQALDARATAATGAAAVEEVARLTEQLAAVRETARADVDRVRAESEAARTEAAVVQQEMAALRRRVRELGDRAAQAERRLATSSPDGDRPPDLPEADRPAPANDAEVRRLRARVADLETALAGAKGNARDSRHASNVRLRVLVDSLVRAAAGVQRELALPPVEERPADVVAAERAVPAAAGFPSLQGRSPDDPTLLEGLLAAPLVHLLVDGYNVTKSGYGEQTLEVQRGRLVAGLAALAARTGAEVTVVFDGVGRTAPVAPASPRGVRVLFSRTGETADDVLRALVRAEPSGRAVIVVTSDRAIVDDVRADGARTAASAALLRLLDR
jgi:predicted RNA-binding protein with PIN domain